MDRSGKRARTKEFSPVTIHGGSIKVVVSYRQTRGDEGFTFDVFTAGGKDRVRLFRFDCLKKEPHLHWGARGTGEIRSLKDKKIPVSWTLTQLESHLRAIVQEIGFAEAAAGIDQNAIREGLSRIRGDILGKP